jgi:hypothetical protein
MRGYALEAVGKRRRRLTEVAIAFVLLPGRLGVRLRGFRIRVLVG